MLQFMNKISFAQMENCRLSSFNSRQDNRLFVFDIVEQNLLDKISKFQYNRTLLRNRKLGTSIEFIKILLLMQVVLLWLQRTITIIGWKLNSKYMNSNQKEKLQVAQIEKLNKEYTNLAFFSTVTYGMFIKTLNMAIYSFQSSALRLSSLFLCIQGYAQLLSTNSTWIFR